MTPEQIDKTIEFLIQHAATFSAQIDALKQQQEETNRVVSNLAKQTAKFEAWASEVVAIESRRLDQHDRLHEDANAFQKEALRLLHRILDRLPPTN